MDCRQANAALQAANRLQCNKSLTVVKRSRLLYCQHLNNSAGGLNPVHDQCPQTQPFLQLPPQQLRPHLAIQKAPRLLHTLTTTLGNKLEFQA
jgi:hypothetical protein